MNPGTVSKILWHFTGGPEYNAEKKQARTKLKANIKAYDILKSIITSKELRLSSYKEAIKVIIPEVSTYNRQTKKREIQYDVEKIITSSQVCCLADIPVQHLEYHSKRYGKFAIGFHRESAIGNNFNPVFYTLKNSKVINSIYQGLASAEKIDPDEIEYNLERIEDIVEDMKRDIEKCEKKHESPEDIWFRKSDIEDEIRDIEKAKKAIKNSIEDFIALVKTFGPSEFASIYCEREWRSLKKFTFNYSDIAMIVIPKKYNYHKKLLESKIVPASVPIVPWEDLIEH